MLLKELNGSLVSDEVLVYPNAESFTIHKDNYIDLYEKYGEWKILRLYATDDSEYEDCVVIDLKQPTPFDPIFDMLDKEEINVWDIKQALIKLETEYIANRR